MTYTRHQHDSTGQSLPVNGVVGLIDSVCWLCQGYLHQGRKVHIIVYTVFHCLIGL